MDPTYTGAYGRIKAYETEFLPEETFRRLMELKTVDDISSMLYGTFYKQDMELFSAIYKGVDLVNISLNHRLIRRNRIALFAAPTPARDIIRSYLAKWDVENIKSIISSKYMGYQIRETENFLVSFRDIPIGMFGGAMTHDDFKALISLGTIEETVNYLSAFGYGQYILQMMDRYRKTGDVGVLLSALDNYNYMKLGDSLKFYNGDEGPIRRFISEEIDLRNIMVILKGIDLGVEFDVLKEALMPMGNISPASLRDMYSPGGVDQALDRLKTFYKVLETAALQYASDRRLEILETSIKLEIYSKYMDVFSQQALSVGSTFAFILRSERERERLRSILFGRYYSISEDRMKRLASLQVV